MVPANSATPTPTALALDPNQTYTIVASGPVQLPNNCTLATHSCSGDAGFFTADPLYCVDVTGGSCGNPRAKTEELQLESQYGVSGFDRFFNQSLAYQDNHSYSLKISGYSGPLTFIGRHAYSYSGCPLCSGSFTVEIFGPPTETVKFGVAQQGHRLLKKHAFEVTRTLGAGQVVVPTPQEGEQNVNSTSAKGSIRYSKVKLSPHGALLLDEDGLTLRVKKAVFYPFDGVNSILVLSVVVTKSTTDSCPLSSTGLVLISDAGSDAIGSDRLAIGIPACKVHDDFRGKPGGGGKSDFVTVAITVVKPQPPA